MDGQNRYAWNAKGGDVMKIEARSELPPPCQACYQVADPMLCENKECKRWREWFITQWNQRRKQLRQMVEQQAQTLQGIPLGGWLYYPPGQLQRYFEKDPCKICWLAQCKCEEPCRIKSNWENAKEEAEI